MKILECYKSYLLAQSGQASAKKLSEILNSKVSHDSITRFLNQAELGETQLWRSANANNEVVNKLAGEDTDLIIDDTIISKPYRKENDQVCWYYNHATGRCEQGIGLMSCLLTNSQTSLCVNYHIIDKTLHYEDKATKRIKRKSKVSKNYFFREMLLKSSKRLRGAFNYVLADNWFCSKDNLKFINDELKKKFIIGIRSNRLISMLASDGTHANHYVALKSANLEPDRVYRVRLKGIDFPVTLVKKVFKNGGNGPAGECYLISNDISLTAEALYRCYQRRWRVEEYHRALKQYASLGTSPSWAVRSQSNHVAASLIAYNSLVLLGISTHKSIHKIRYEIVLKCNLSAFDALRSVQKLAA